LSKGFIGQARHHAVRVLDLLNQVDPAREVSIVGVEPPEIYMFKHDYVDLLPNREAEINQRASRVWLLDEFLLRSTEFYDLRVVNKKRLFDARDNLSRKKIMFHPHCHQRAEGPAPDGLPHGTSATLELLRACGYEVELMDTGCCGMAGTFGYEAEHYELSMKIGKLKLFPALAPPVPPRATPPPDSNARAEMGKKTLNSNLEKAGEGLVLSTGAACRMQIQQGTGLKAIHPVLLIAGLIKEADHAER